MDYSQNRNEMRLKYLSEQIKLEKDLSKFFDTEISNIKTEISETLKQNIFIRLKNNTLRHEEPILSANNSDRLVEVKKITKCANDQHISKENYVNDLTGQMKTVTVVYKNFSEMIKKSGNVIQDNQHYKRLANELERKIELKKIELNHRQESLKISRVNWENEIEDKCSIHNILCEIEKETDGKLKKADILPSSFKQTQTIVNLKPPKEKHVEIFKKPWTPKQVLNKC